jgi:arsenate reductase
MDEIGIDIREQWSESIKEYLGKEHFHYLITVCSDAEKNCPTAWPGVNERLYWPFDDPAAGYWGRGRDSGRVPPGTR